jgi:hypothetical protein
VNARKRRIQPDLEAIIAVFVAVRTTSGLAGVRGRRRSVTVSGNGDAAGRASRLDNP